MNKAQKLIKEMQQLQKGLLPSINKKPYRKRVNLKKIQAQRENFFQDLEKILKEKNRN